MPEMGDRQPIPPGGTAPTPPLGLAQIVPSTISIDVMPGPEGKPYVVMRWESLNGSQVYGLAPHEARNVARIIVEQAANAERQTNGLVTPNQLDPSVLDRLMKPPHPG